MNEEIMEFIDVNELIVVDEDVYVYVDTDTKSDVLVSYPKGSMVFLSGKSDKWYRVVYRGQEGYMKTDSAVVNVNINVDELDEEFAEDARNENALVENIQAQQAYKKSNIIWTSVIIVLVLAIVGVTIFERKKRRGDEKLDGDKSGIREWDDNIEIVDDSELPDAVEVEENLNKENDDKKITDEDNKESVQKAEDVEETITEIDSTEENINS